MLNTRDERDSEVNSEEPSLKKSRKGKEPEGSSSKKRPMNAFILFRNARSQEVKAQYPRFQSRNGTISKIVAITWAAMTDAEQQPWFDEYLHLRRLESDFKDVNGGENPRRRKPRKEEDRLKAVAQLQLIQQQNANGEELTFSDGSNGMVQRLEEAKAQFATPLDKIVQQQEEAKVQFATPLDRVVQRQEEAEVRLGTPVDNTNKTPQGHEEAEVRLGTPLGNNNERSDDLAQISDVLPKPADLGVEVNRSLDSNSAPNAAPNLQVNQHSDRQHEVATHHETPIDDLEFFGQNSEIDFDMGEFFDFNEE
ncbi:hypothetical protein RRF57_006031 [Xylaria bambusicola]|uniref:HMG box domain-containing protein n=1 Tax=Xylaria bambusicola TaxID=326684 RepID=A0AAN7UPJ8_9PEZI